MNHVGTTSVGVYVGDLILWLKGSGGEVMGFLLELSAV